MTFKCWIKWQHCSKSDPVSHHSINIIRSRQKFIHYHSRKFPSALCSEIWLLTKAQAHCLCVLQASHDYGIFTLAALVTGNEWVFLNCVVTSTLHLSLKTSSSSPSHSVCLWPDSAQCEYSIITLSFTLLSSKIMRSFYISVHTIPPHSSQNTDLKSWGQKMWNR